MALLLRVCGNTQHLVELMCNSGAVGLSLDSKVDFNEIKNNIPKKLYLMGNLDPVSVFLHSSPGKVAEVTSDLCDMMQGNENFILSSGCDIPLDTPLENITAFMNAARKTNERIALEV